MVDSTSDRVLLGDVDELEQLNWDLEKMVENMENISVQLTWMAYDMVVLRTSPEVGDSRKNLEEEFLRCKTVLESNCLGRSTGN